ncbi:hypothetical protein AXI59_18305 [Bacillus nakamurai]|uniref:hypothetical protein n=1 Tax=Bacillus nakamurai TaxID=1793963 RepID=UPI0007781B2B|nr:hypothetical protein [Bacillus nakamurai]KXZ16855.1 hypothetical protein AXI59_18305 [Bacillus nakamurai]
MKGNFLNIIIILGLLLIIGSVTVFKDFDYQQYLRYGGAVLIAFGFIYGYDKEKIKKKIKLLIRVASET